MKTHEMNTRNTEKFHVYHAHTERLKNSAVVYMQRLLNEYEKSQKWKPISEIGIYQLKLAL